MELYRAGGDGGDHLRDEVGEEGVACDKEVAWNVGLKDDRLEEHEQVRAQPGEVGRVLLVRRDKDPGNAGPRLLLRAEPELYDVGDDHRHA